MSESENKKSSWKLNLVMLWFSQLLVMAGFSAMIPFIPLFLKDELMVTDKHDLALYITLFNFFGTMAYAIFVPIWGFLSDRFGVKPMLLRGTFVTAFIYPCMGYVTTPAMLVFLRFATAACAGTTSASQTMIARTTPDNRQGFALGLLSTSATSSAASSSTTIIICTPSGSAASSISSQDSPSSSRKTTAHASRSTPIL